MFFWPHLIYTLLFLIYGIFSSLAGPGTRDELDQLPKNKKNKIRAIPYIQILLVLVFPIMNGIIRDEFGQKFVFELITAGFFSIAIFLSCTQTGSQFKKGWLLYVAFFVYTLIKNIVVLDGFFITLIAQIQATVTLAFVSFYTFILSLGTNPKSKAEQEKNLAELGKYNEECKQREAEKQAQEAQKRYEEEQKRLREEQEARTHAAYERIVLGKKSSTPSSSNHYSGSNHHSGQSYLDNYYNRGELGFASATACCNNCRHYSGGICTCSQSHAHNQSIFNPHTSSCGWHS